MNAWNGLDFFIFLIFLVNTIQGMMRGATKEIISMMSLSIGLIFMIKFTVPLAVFLNKSPLAVDMVGNSVTIHFMQAIGAGPLTMELLNQIFYSISMLICFVGAFCAAEAAMAYPGFVEFFSFPYATLNRKVGAGLGCTRGYVLNLILITILATHIFNNAGNIVDGSMVSGSYFVKLFEPAANGLNALITSQAPDRYREIYQNKNLYNVTNVMQNVQGGSGDKEAQDQMNQALPPPAPTTPPSGNPTQPPSGDSQNGSVNNNLTGTLTNPAAPQ